MSFLAHGTRKISLLTAHGTRKIKVVKTVSNCCYSLNTSHMINTLWFSTKITKCYLFIGISVYLLKIFGYCTKYMKIDPKCTFTKFIGVNFEILKIFFCEKSICEENMCALRYWKQKRIQDHVKRLWWRFLAKLSITLLYFKKHVMFTLLAIFA